MYESDSSMTLPLAKPVYVHTKGNVREEILGCNVIMPSVMML